MLGGDFIRPLNLALSDKHGGVMIPKKSCN